ncbi:MAG: transcriptional regulator PpsR [Gemmatimonadales bacterium]|nr:transcriptional regulator PpsR [Gemmatimonadales bacterium]
MTKALGKVFEARVAELGELDPSAIAAVIQAAADIALVVDPQGVIRDISTPPTDGSLGELRDWVGQTWTDTVSSETQQKVREMLQEAQSAGVSGRRQVNHLSAAGPDIPIAYTAIRVGSAGGVVAVGRDLRAMSVLQQRLVEAQQAMERDYWRMRHIETRYRLLFQLSAEAVVIVDAATRRLVAANPAAGRLFDQQPKRLVGRIFPLDLDEASTKALDELLATVRTSGRSEEIPVRLVGREARVTLGASLVRQDGSAFFLLRLWSEQPAGTAGAVASGMPGAMVEVLQGAPDAFVLCDVEGRLRQANRAFLDLCQLATEEQARGQPLSRWFGRPGADLAVLLATLREHGVVRLFASSVRGEYGSVAEVEVSAVMAPAGGQPCVGLTIRDIGRRLASGPQGARDLTRAVEQLTALVGRVSLRDLTRDTTDLVERHFIEAALELTSQNRTLAAEMLGVSRQSLYVKLRRYQLGGGDTPRAPLPA